MPYAHGRGSDSNVLSARETSDAQRSKVEVIKAVVVVVVAGGTSRFNYGHLASLRLTTTETETHNERLCAHMLGDHTGHAYPCVCANVCMCGMCIFK
jgi:hypothetical protein